MHLSRAGWITVRQLSVPPPSGILFPLPGITVSPGPYQARPVPDSDLMSLACRLAVMVVSYTVPDLYASIITSIAENGNNDDCR